LSPIDDDTTQFIPASGGGFGGGGRSGSIPPGTVLSHTYRVEAFLAKGGMGEVYKAQHVELHTWHAIKVIQDEFASNPKVMDLFRREAGVLRGLRHDAVVGYDGLMRDEAGRIFMAMEFVEGSPLSSMLKYGPLSVEDVKILRDRIGAGLAAAHRTGVVHRDMSPDNIILPNDRPENAKIIDFGIAKLSDPNQATVLGDDFAGKYSYAAPEQLGLFGGHVDHRSDIYSFGLVLAAAATGRALDMGSNPMQILEARKSLPDLSGIPEALVDDLAKMLQPDPAERLQSLEQAVGGVAPPSPAPAPARPKPAPEPEKKGGSKVMLGVVGVAVVAAVGIGAAVMLTGGDEPASTGGTEVAAVTPEPQPEPQPDPGPDPQASVGGGETVSGGEIAAPSTPGDVGGAGGGETNVGGAPATPDGGVSTPEAPTSPATPDQPGAGTEVASLDPTPDLTDRYKEIDAALRDVQCGFVNARFTDPNGPLFLTGHVPDDTEKRILTATLSEAPGVTSIDSSSLQTLSSPRCDMIEMLGASGLTRSAEQLADPVALGRYAQLGQLHFRAGERLRLDLTAPSFAAYYYVDFFDSDGNVIHLLPSPIAPDNSLAPNEAVVIGGTDRYTISPPFGVDLVVAIGTNTPLFPDQRPELENAVLYRQALDNALRTHGSSPDFKGEFSYVFIETSP